MVLNLLLWGKKEKVVNKAENRRPVGKQGSGANLEAGKQQTAENQITRCIPAFEGQDHRSRHPRAQA